MSWLYMYSIIPKIQAVKQMRYFAPTNGQRMCLAVGGKIPADLRIAQLNCKNFTVDQVLHLLYLPTCTTTHFSQGICLAAKDF